MNKRKITGIIILIVIIFPIILSGYFYYQIRSMKNISKAGSSVEVKNLIDKVSRLYLIPSDEEPTIATVSDPLILKDQSFFSLAEKDDKVFIFNKAGKAVLYRPSIDKIIEIAPIKNSSAPVVSSVPDVVTPPSNSSKSVTPTKEKVKTRVN